MAETAKGGGAGEAPSPWPPAVVPMARVPSFAPRDGEMSWPQRGCGLSLMGGQEVEHGLEDRLGLLQRQEMPGFGNVDDLGTLTDSRAECVTVAGGAAVSSSPWTTSIGAAPPVHQSANGV